MPEQPASQKPKTPKPKEQKPRTFSGLSLFYAKNDSSKFVQALTATCVKVGIHARRIRIADPRKFPETAIVTAEVPVDVVEKFAPMIRNLTGRDMAIAPEISLTADQWIKVIDHSEMSLADKAA